MKTLKLQKLEDKFNVISQKIEKLEDEKASLEHSMPYTKENTRYFKIDYLVIDLEQKQYEIQLKIKALNA